MTAMGTVPVAFLVSIAKGLIMAGMNNSEMEDLMASILNEAEQRVVATVDAQTSHLVSTPTEPITDPDEQARLISEFESLIGTEVEEQDEPEVVPEVEPEVGGYQHPNVESLEGIIGQLQAALQAAIGLLENLKTGR